MIFTKFGVVTFIVAIAGILFLKLVFEPWVIEVSCRELVKCD
jgi:hypothetical protein